jgi:NAD(P)-dependent dehydrogenase (short-subunit alcohol dehydrogenase family)
MLLEERVAFVTAAGSGIGRAGAVAMAAEGAVVIVTDRDADRAASVAREIVQAGGRAEARALDVGDDAAVAAEIAGAAARHGRLDILHSHAGIQIPGRLDEVTPEQMDISWRLNVRSHFVAARAAMPVMTARGKGSIIITSSNSGVQYDREMIAYATTKHAVVAMTRQMAVDYARHNVRCNALCPGFVDTPFNDGFERQMGGRSALEAYVAGTIPMGRWGTPDEIARGIVFLASDQSSFMTGHALVIDGAECV